VNSVIGTTNATVVQIEIFIMFILFYTTLCLLLLIQRSPFFMTKLPLSELILQWVTHFSTVYNVQQENHGINIIKVSLKFYVIK